MSPPEDAVRAVRYGFPRASGDEPEQRPNVARVDVFSPRERG